VDGDWGDEMMSKDSWEIIKNVVTPISIHINSLSTCQILRHFASLTSTLLLIAASLAVSVRGLPGTAREAAKRRAAAKQRDQMNSKEYHAHFEAHIRGC
jgi:hypothetical protein